MGLTQLIEGPIPPQNPPPVRFPTWDWIAVAAPSKGSSVPFAEPVGVKPRTVNVSSTTNGSPVRSTLALPSSMVPAQEAACAYGIETMGVGPMQQSKPTLA